MFKKLFSKSRKMETLKPVTPAAQVAEPHLYESNLTLFEELFDKQLDGYQKIDYKNAEAMLKFKALSNSDRAEFLLAYAQRNTPIWNKKSKYAREAFGRMLRNRVDFEPKQITKLLNDLLTYKSRDLIRWRLHLIINQLEKSLKTNTLSDSERDQFIEISKWPVWSEKTFTEDLHTSKLKLADLLGQSETLTYFDFGTTYIGQKIRDDLNLLDPDNQKAWYKIFHVSSLVKGSKPTLKTRSQLNNCIEGIGKEIFRHQVQKWIEWITLTSNAFFEPTDSPNGQRIVGYGKYVRGHLNPHMQTPLKGLVWAMASFHDQKTLSLLSNLTEKCFKNLANIGGPPAPALGNACIYTLGASKGLSGVAHLSRLKLRIKQNNTQKLIQKKIDENAKRLGLKPAEIEEMAAPDFGLEQGIRDYPFKDYTLRLTATRVGEAKLSWIKPDGAPQKSVPSFIKESEPLKKSLTAVRATAKNIKKASTAQRDRIDRLYTEDMSWSEEALKKAYLDHGLVGPMARALIWQLEIGKKKLPALRRGEVWEDAKGKAITGEISSIRLWHPIMDKIEVITAWRDRLEELEIRQPMKQAFREVYILTDAEITTRIYSNRMAAHIVKQHQMNVLMATRGWAYSLLGCYDDGRDGEIALKPLPAYGLTAQFWIDILNDDEENWNDSGIYHYVATDQVRFTSPNSEGVPLVDIPPIILSEVLRDADLFVGVGSVGNDPTWADRDGEPRQQRYWQSYAFGDLNETAKTRKVVLERLLPRLKIKDVTSIDGRFLRVQGKQNIYKIHIGSGNIQIATQGDRYLCIVPGRGKDKSLENIYLPFEGDRGLSIVLSKAFLLAADDKITDTTILSQLK